MGNLFTKQPTSPDNQVAISKTKKNRKLPHQAEEPEESSPPVNRSKRSTSDHICSDMKCHEISKMIKRGDFISLARHLGVDQNKVEEFEVERNINKYSDSDLVFKILTTWKEMKGSQATEKRLIEALEQIERRDIVDKVFHVSRWDGSHESQVIEGIFSEIRRRHRDAYVKLKLPQQAPWMNKILVLEDLYVNLEMHEITGDYEDKEGETIELEELFAPVDDGEPRRILVEGGPGMGKTTFCWKLLNDWGLQREYLFERFKLIFLIFLRDVKEGESIDDVFAIVCQSEDFKRVDLLHCIHQHQHEILLLLDGYDELSEETKRKFLPLLTKKKFPNMFVLLTSRSGMFHVETDKKSRMLDASRSIDTETRKLQLFNKRVVIKGIDESEIQGFLKKYLGDCSTDLEEKMDRMSQGEMKEICKCPLFLLLLATMIEEDQLREMRSKTDLYKSFFNFLVRRSLVREKLLLVAEDIKLFHSTQTPRVTRILINFGKVAVENLIRNALTFNESAVLKYCENDVTVFNLGFLIKLEKLENHSAENYYETIHKSFVEFSAAFYLYNVFRDSGERAFKTEIDRVTRNGLLPTGDSLFFVFIGGFLKDRASLLFEALLPHSSWFHLENLCFTNTLMEIEDVHNFMDSFRPLLPCFVPSFYSFGAGWYSMGRDFTSSSIHSLLLNSALQQPNLVHCLQWAPSHSISIHKNVIINHLRLCLTADLSAEEDVLSGENSLKCKTLSLRLTNSFQMERWPNVVGVVDCIERETTRFDLTEGEGGLNSSVLVALHKELTKGQWKGKIIHRIRFQLTEKDDPLCLRLLLDLVTNNKIKDGVYVIMEKWAKSEREKRQMSLDLQELFHSVVQSKTVDDLFVHNADFTCSPVFDLSRYNRDDNIRFKSLWLSGSLSVLNETANAKPLTEEAIITCWGGEEKNSKLIQSLQGIKWLYCQMACFDFLVDDKYPWLQKLEELELIVDESLSLSPAISSLLQLRVLTLNFAAIERIARGSSDVAFTRLLSSLPLRIIELISIPRDVSSFDWLIACVVKGLEERKEKSNAPPPLLHEFLFYFAGGSGWDWNDLKASGGVNGIRRMLLTHLVRQCSWVSSSNDLPRALPRSLFPMDDKFTIKVDVDGADSSSSRLSQWEYRWMAMSNKYCITCTGE